MTGMCLPSKAVPSFLQAAVTGPETIIASSIGDETVVAQNACLPSISGPLPSNSVYTGVPPTAKQWTLPSSLADNTTLRLSYGMYLCYNVAVLLMSVVLSLLPVAAIVAAIHTLPGHIAQNLAASAGACNSPVHFDAYHSTSFEMGQLAAGTTAWCEIQAEGCSSSSYLSEMGRRMYEQADPARSIGAVHKRTIVPCRADSCVHFDDDVPGVLPRCIANVSRTTERCPEMLKVHNATVSEVRALPRCVMDVLVECSQQAIVATLDWAPTGDLVPPLTCARLAAEDMFTIFSWREPLETLQSCVQLMHAYLVFYLVFIFTMILWKKLIVGRFRSGTWDMLDFRSKEWTKTSGYVLSVTMFGNDTLSKALNGSQWQLVFCYLYGMRVGRRVFVDRNVVLMGARSACPSQRIHPLVAALPSSCALSLALPR